MSSIASRLTKATCLLLLTMFLMVLVRNFEPDKLILNAEYVREAVDLAPESNITTDKWLRFDNYEIIMFSVYFDKRSVENAVIRILLYKPFPSGHTGKCVTKFENRTTVELSGTFYLTDHQARPKQAWKYEPYHLICKINANLTSKPQAVAMKLGEKVSSFLLITESYAPKIRPHMLTVCTKPLYKFVDWLRLAVFIEYYRVVGASRIIFYNHSISADVNAILEHYVRDGLVSMIQMPEIPHPTPTPTYIARFDDYHHVGQQLQINDCIIRTANSSYFWTDVDLDEFLGMPETLENSLYNFLKTKVGPKVGGIQVRSVFWEGKWPPIAPLTQFQRGPLQMFQPFPISAHFASTVRSKMIVRPEAVEAKSVHIVFEYKKGWNEIVMKPTEATVYHLRRGGGGKVGTANPFEKIETLIMNSVEIAVECVKNLE